MTVGPPISDEPVLRCPAPGCRARFCNTAKDFHGARARRSHRSQGRPMRIFTKPFRQRGPRAAPRRDQTASRRSARDLSLTDASRWLLPGEVLRRRKRAPHRLRGHPVQIQVGIRLTGAPAELEVRPTKALFARAESKKKTDLQGDDSTIVLSIRFNGLGK